MATFLDSNILLALVNKHEDHHEWSQKEVERCKAENGPAIVTDIVFCEASVSMKDVEEIRDLIDEWKLERMRMSDEALFLAGKAFHTYKKKNKGPKTGVLPDFLVGALAQAEGEDLMTIDVARYNTYFPTVKLITPPDIKGVKAADADIEEEAAAGEAS